jgi:predicted DNA-binding protein (UPF0251 family)
MYFCSAEKCALCLLVYGSPNCLRKQAANCIGLSKTVFRRAVRDALEELGLMLIEEASATEKSPTIPALPWGACNGGL